MQIKNFQRMTDISKEIRTLTESWDKAVDTTNVFNTDFLNRYAGNMEILNATADHLRELTIKRVNELQKEIAEL